MAELVGMSVEVFLRWDRESDDARPEEGRQENDRTNIQSGPIFSRHPYLAHEDCGLAGPLLQCC